MPGPIRPKRDYKFNHPITLEQLHAIGMIAVEGSQFEQFLELAIWAMLGLPTKIGALLTTRQNFDMKIKTFARVANRKFNDKELRQKAANLASRFRDSSGRRNDIIHALWPHPDDGPGIEAISRKLDDDGEFGRSLQTDPSSLQKIAADLRADFDDLFAFLNEAKIPPPKIGG